VSGPRIAVIGPGAIGAVFAAAVQQAGHKEMVLCARHRLGRIAVDRDGHDPVLIDAPVLSDPASVSRRWPARRLYCRPSCGAQRKLQVLDTSGCVASHMYRQPGITALAHDLAVECLEVARAESAQLTDSVADAIVADFAAMPADLGSSILFDREAGRRLEWEARNGAVRRIGARHRIPTPISDVIVPLLAAASGEE
jgi:ketopantoate reductase